MNKQEILYNNKLIAHFMDGKYWPKSWNPFKKYHNRYEFPGFRIGIPPEQLMFHNHWNWLMWVINKIENDYPKVQITIEEHKCIFRWEGKFTITKIARTRFTAIYQSILDFIKYLDDEKREEELKKATEYAENLKNPTIF